MRWRTWEEVPNNIKIYYFVRSSQYHLLPMTRGIYDTDTPLERAAIMYWDRNIPLKCTPVGVRGGRGAPQYQNRVRIYGPHGHYTGKYGLSVWMPNPIEVMDCCRHLKLPSPKAPWAFKVHCNSIRHVAQIWNIDPKALKARIDMDLGRVHRPTHCEMCNHFAAKDDIYCKTHRWCVDTLKEADCLV
jgi:hypothetical protein